MKRLLCAALAALCLALTVALVLAAVALGAFVACIWMVFQSRLTGMDAAQIALIGGVVGYASAKADTVIAYYFGSSKGSDDASRLLYKSTPNPGD